MPISAVAAVIPIPQPAVTAAQQNAPSMTSAIQNVLQTEQTHAGGGGGGHRTHKSALDAMSQIAASQNAKPKQRAKSVRERQAEIERMKEEQRQNPGERDLAEDRGRRGTAWQHDDDRNALSALF
jgi:hypothetical protein